MNTTPLPPRLALCIPAFNAGKFLPRLLHSAAGQKIPFDEVLVFDDCSTDDTAEVAHSLGARVVRGEQNLGCSVGKNALMAETDCEWIHFHDADDDMLPNFTTLAHRWMERVAPPDVILFDYEIRDFIDDHLVSVRRFDSEKIRAEPGRYAIRHQINPYCGLYKRKAMVAVGGYDEDPKILYNEDCRFHMRLAFFGLRFDVEPEIAIVNLDRQGSMSSSNREKCSRARLAVIEKASLETGPEFHQEIGLEAWLCARHLGSFGLWAEMARAIRLARSTGITVPMEEEKTIVRMMARLAPNFTFRLRANFVGYRDALLWANQQRFNKLTP